RERGDSNWMSRLPEELLDVPLWNLAIPGSHDSMSFCLDLSSPVLGSEPFLLRLTDRLLPCWWNKDNNHRKHEQIKSNVMMETF
uniref:Phosphatidylinositol-specific phospholipase C X domain-containing protein n=1 Tax=Cyprinodon variegatus TaxID=28743 RepID=A0A3Q2G6X3_CYPVA